MAKPPPSEGWAPEDPQGRAVRGCLDVLLLAALMLMLAVIFHEVWGS